MSEPGRFSVRLDDLEGTARVPLDEQVEERHATAPTPDPAEPIPAYLRYPG